MIGSMVGDLHLAPGEEVSVGVDRETWPKSEALGSIDQNMTSSYQLISAMSRNGWRRNSSLDTGHESGIGSDSDSGTGSPLCTDRSFSLSTVQEQPEETWRRAGNNLPDLPIYLEDRLAQLIIPSQAPKQSTGHQRTARKLHDSVNGYEKRTHSRKLPRIPSAEVQNSSRMEHRDLPDAVFMSRGQLEQPISASALETDRIREIPSSELWAKAASVSKDRALQFYPSENILKAAKTNKNFRPDDQVAVYSPSEIESVLYRQQTSGINEYINVPDYHVHNSENVTVRRDNFRYKHPKTMNQSPAGCAELQPSTEQISFTEDKMATFPRTAKKQKSPYHKKTSELGPAERQTDSIDSYVASLDRRVKTHLKPIHGARTRARPASAVALTSDRSKELEQQTESHRRTSDDSVLFTGTPPVSPPNDDSWLGKIGRRLGIGTKVSTGDGSEFDVKRSDYLPTGIQDDQLVDVPSPTLPTFQLATTKRDSIASGTGRRNDGSFQTFRGDVRPMQWTDDARTDYQSRWMHNSIAKIMNDSGKQQLTPTAYQQLNSKVGSGEKEPLRITSAQETQLLNEYQLSQKSTPVQTSAAYSLHNESLRQLTERSELSTWLQDKQQNHVRNNQQHKEWKEPEVTSFQIPVQKQELHKRQQQIWMKQQKLQLQQRQKRTVSEEEERKFSLQQEERQRKRLKEMTEPFVRKQQQQQQQQQRSNSVPSAEDEHQLMRPHLTGISSGLREWPKDHSSKKKKVPTATLR